MDETQSDADLMKRYRAGDETAFAFIYERYGAQVYAYLRKKIERPEERDEVFQGVFYKFHRSRDQYDAKYPLLQWLYVISRSVWLDDLKKKNRALPTVELSSIHEVTESATLHAQAEQAKDFKPQSLTGWEHLGEKQREIIELKIMDELTYQEIAQRVQESEANVRQLFSRALRKLKASAKKTTPDPSPILSTPAASTPTLSKGVKK